MSRRRSLPQPQKITLDAQVWQEFGEAYARAQVALRDKQIECVQLLRERDKLIDNLASEQPKKFRWLQGHFSKIAVPLTEQAARKQRHRREWLHGLGLVALTGAVITGGVLSGLYLPGSPQDIMSLFTGAAQETATPAYAVVKADIAHVFREPAMHAHTSTNIRQGVIVQVLRDAEKDWREVKVVLIHDGRFVHAEQPTTGYMRAKDLMQIKGIR